MGLGHSVSYYLYSVLQSVLQSMLQSVLQSMLQSVLQSVSYYLYTRPCVYSLRERRETLERRRRELGSCAVCSLFYRALLQKRPII